MTNLAAHPNVVKAHSVFNVSGYFICELEFAGHVHLQQYTRIPGRAGPIAHGLAAGGRRLTLGKLQAL